MDDKLQSLHNVLTDKGYAPCKPLLPRNDISVKESGNLYRLAFASRQECVAYRIDGEIVTEGAKCDFLILAEHERADKWITAWKEVFVELKGKDVVHALQQLDKTVRMKTFSHPSNKRIYARLVAKAIPSASLNPEYRKAKIRFEKDHPEIHLKTLKSGQPDSLK